MNEFFEGNDAQNIFLDCEVSVDAILKAQTLHSETGLANYQGDIDLFKHQGFLNIDIIDSDKFDGLVDFKIETKFNYSNGPEYWESIKLISLNNQPFIVFIIQGDNNIDHIINNEVYNLFIDNIKECLAFKNALSPEEPDHGIIKF